MSKFAAELSGVDRARAVVAQMLSTDGCAWHLEQTHSSLTKYMLEEAYEAVDAIDRNLPSATIAEELGDVLYQVLFHAELAAKHNEGYDLDSIGDELAEKLIARHPHVFGNLGNKSAQELTEIWEELKAQARTQQAAAQEPAPVEQEPAQAEPMQLSTQLTQNITNTDRLFAGIPAGLPALAKAQKMAERIHNQGADPRQLLAAVEIDSDESAYAAELYELISRAVTDGIDIDRALRQLLIAGSLAE